MPESYRIEAYTEYFWENNISKLDKTLHFRSFSQIVHLLNKNLFTKKLHLFVNDTLVPNRNKLRVDQPNRITSIGASGKS